MAPLPHRDLRHPWLRYQVDGYDEGIIHSYEQRLETIWGRPVNRVHVLDFAGLTDEINVTSDTAATRKSRDTVTVCSFCRVSEEEVSRTENDINDRNLNLNIVCSLLAQTITEHSEASATHFRAQRTMDSIKLLDVEVSVLYLEEIGISKWFSVPSGSSVFSINIPAFSLLDL
ncbi:hypothetical protein Tco_0770292 [Tanacetum coccineum]|uniref:Uncharacterized protein n=1 Tax=Tanacetum coccineum TaxID=301880 RepID=A0ABQ4ZDQ8_9ASTR